MLPEELRADIDAINCIDVVPSILEVACRTTGMGFAAVARVTDERWIACCVRDEIQFGLQAGGELPLETTLCNEIRQTGKEVVIDDVALDAIYRAHHTPARYGFQSYISMPIRLPNGSFFGTLCAIDPKPARISGAETIAMFRLFAELIAMHLDAHQRLRSTQENLLLERQNAELREQFIAVLGHDLRNPLASIAGGANLLRRSPLTREAKAIVDLLDTSVRRMAGLIDDVLDFARGRLGGGLPLQRKADEHLLDVIGQVVGELRISHPDRTIELAMDMREPVRCDRVRMGQLLSNLLSNALVHGDLLAAVRVESTAKGGRFELSVINRGQPISQAVREKLFEPFFRGEAQPSKQGLGLGLYIASEIARSHAGEITVTSTEQETRFTLRMPTAGTT